MMHQNKICFIIAATFEEKSSYDGNTFWQQPHFRITDRYIQLVWRSAKVKYDDDDDD